MWYWIAAVVLYLLVILLLLKMLGVHTPRL